MERKPVYSIFPAPPTSPTPQQNNRPSTDSRARPSLEQPPYPPPSSPLPPVPKPALPVQQIPGPSQRLPPTPDSLRPIRLSSRRRQSPNREFADFQRELAQSSHRHTSPPRHRPTSSRGPPSRQGTHAPPSRRSSQPSTQSSQPSDRADHAMYTSTLSTSSTSSLSLSKPPLLSPPTTVVPTPQPLPGPRHHRPNTVYFHGGIGGAGNYRKVIRENNRAPRAYAANAEPLRRSSPTRFLSSLFGGGSSHGAGGGAGRRSLDEMASGSEESVREEVSLGAAEVLRRKMVGAGRRKKGGS